MFNPFTVFGKICVGILKMLGLGARGAASASKSVMSSYEAYMRDRRVRVIYISESNVVYDTRGKLLESGTLLSVPAFRRLFSLSVNHTDQKNCEKPVFQEILRDEHLNDVIIVSGGSLNVHEALQCANSDRAKQIAEHGDDIPEENFEVIDGIIQLIPKKASREQIIFSSIASQVMDANILSFLRRPDERERAAILIIGLLLGGVIMAIIFAFIIGFAVIV